MKGPITEDYMKLVSPPALWNLDGSVLIELKSYLQLGRDYYFLRQERQDNVNMRKVKDAVERQEWSRGGRGDGEGQGRWASVLPEENGIANVFLLNAQCSVMEPIITRNCICNTSTAFTGLQADYLTNYCQHMESPRLKPLIWDLLPNLCFITVKFVWQMKTVFVSADVSRERPCVGWALTSVSSQPQKRRD